MTAMTKTFPGRTWEIPSPKEAGFDPNGLAAAEVWLKDNANGEPYRALVARRGRIVAQWDQGVVRDEKLELASATKLAYSNMLGIIAAEGKLEHCGKCRADLA